MNVVIHPKDAKHFIFNYWKRGTDTITSLPVAEFPSTLTLPVILNDAACADILDLLKPTFCETWVSTMTLTVKVTETSLTFVAKADSPRSRTEICFTAVKL